MRPDCKIVLLNSFGDFSCFLTFFFRKPKKQLIQKMSNSDSTDGNSSNNTNNNSKTNHNRIPSGKYPRDAFLFHGRIS